ncbi:amidohydrolase family protein [Virgibacillus salarius]|uniref:amidohydrolase family protein n=1 Tax=Virgibacillus salarius TaxID=447199 RepID=UPI0031EDDF31
MLENGTLAGSILKMHEGAQQMLSMKDVSIKNIVEMTAMNPAKQVGMFKTKGSILDGKDADILIVDDQLSIKYTICRGVVAFEGDDGNGTN